jgi:tetratricopeptide (TPR) repeat protein
VLWRALFIAVLLAVAVVLDATVPAVSQLDQGFGAASRPALGRGPSATPGPLSLAAIDELVFSNQYEKAEKAYTARLAAVPDDPAGHAAHALFLTYAGQLSRALGEARKAVALSGADGRAHAVLCRALDWNGLYPEAVAEGRRGTRLSPDDPLTHLYLSEALADNADTAAAKAEIDAASQLIRDSSPAYVRAELHRELANLARDQGNQLVQIDALTAAENVQPSWVERVSELAAALFTGNDVEHGHAEFEKALKLRGDDVSMLVSLGSTALLAADYADAKTAYTRAGQLAPQNLDALHGLAQVAMASDGDPDAAAAHLAAALRVSPSDAASAAYLLYIARDVWRDEARGKRMIDEAVAGGSEAAPAQHPHAAPDVDGIQAQHAQSALERVNAVRLAAGLPAVKLDDRLTASAAAHSFYWLFNQARASQKGLGIHGETPGTPGFSGSGVYDRDSAFGWRDGPVGEDITHRGSPVLAVRDWVDSVYHRFPILRPDLRAIGYADAVMASLPIEDMEFGFSPPGGAHANPVLYPADAQTGVPASFYDNELPDPVPAGGPRVTGYPVTVTFDRYSSVRVTAFTLAGPSGAPVQPVYTLPPSDQTENSASLLAGASLIQGARYTAHIVATVDGAPFDRTWSFTVNASA